MIQQALDCLLRGRTRIVIAPRLSTVQNADIFYTRKEGEIVEEGSHEELPEMGGLEADLDRRPFFVPPGLQAAG